MSGTEFEVGEWIDRLASALFRLNMAQEIHLQEYYRQDRPVRVLGGGQVHKRPGDRLDDLRVLYSLARSGRGEDECFAPLCEVLNPARYILLSHPTLETVTGPIIGRDKFWVDILGSGLSVTVSDLIAGLMARAAELPGDGFRQAAGELNALLAPAREAGPAEALGGLDVGYHAVLFYGLTLKDRIDIEPGLTMLPFEQAQAFIDESAARQLGPPGAEMHAWQSMGVVVMPFRWRAEFRQTGHVRARKPDDTAPFFDRATAFLQLVGVAHETPVLRLGTFDVCIDRSAGRLLGGLAHGGSYRHGRSARAFNGFDPCPEPVPERFAEAREALALRDSDRFSKLQPALVWLSEALVEDGTFAPEVRFVHVAKALERMYDLPTRGLSEALQKRVAGYLGAHQEDRERLKNDSREFYRERSASVHDRKKKASRQKNRVAFAKGFNIARRTIFKQLREGPPGNWGELEAWGD